MQNCCVTVSLYSLTIRELFLYIDTILDIDHNCPPKIFSGFSIKSKVLIDCKYNEDFICISTINHNTKLQIYRCISVKEFNKTFTICLCLERNNV